MPKPTARPTAQAMYGLFTLARIGRSLYLFRCSQCKVGLCCQSDAHIYQNGRPKARSNESKQAVPAGGQGSSVSNFCSFPAQITCRPMCLGKPHPKAWQKLSIVLRGSVFRIPKGSFFASVWRSLPLLIRIGFACGAFPHCCKRMVFFAGAISPFLHFCTTFGQVSIVGYAMR